MSEKSVIVIGAGIAGLSAGVYSAMNGYKTQIFEMHSIPGGLMTGWKRKGYTVEGCIHWLTGSAPGSGMYPYWEEIGLIQNRQIIDMDEFTRYEGKNGGVLIIYCNIDRLEKHMLELAPEDEKIIREMMGAIRRLKNYVPPMGGEQGLVASIKTMIGSIPYLPILTRWMKVTTVELSERFKNPLLKEAFANMWGKDFSSLFIMMTLAWLDKKEAGYPIGGSLPMAHAVEQRFKALGGEIRYGARVEKILVENDRAVGVRLVDGSEHRADFVISAADGYATIFKMLDGKYVDDKIRGYYEKLPTFGALLHFGLGINRDFKDFPAIVGGMTFPLDEPITLGNESHDRLGLHVFNYDPTLAPKGKTLATVMVPASYEYWKSLEETDTELYQAKKTEAGERVIAALDRRFPGLAQDIEMCDVATPVTFERYTGNWKGCFEGWLITPKTAMMQMSKTLPGLENFYMAGQWVMPGGGLPSGAITGRAVVEMICKKDKAPFKTTKA